MILPPRPHSLSELDAERQRHLAEHLKGPPGNRMLRLAFGLLGSLGVGGLLWATPMTTENAPLILGMMILTFLVLEVFAHVFFKLQLLAQFASFDDLQPIQLTEMQIARLEAFKHEPPIQARLLRIQSSEVPMLKRDWDDLQACLDAIEQERHQDEVAQRLAV